MRRHPFQGIVGNDKERMNCMAGILEELAYSDVPQIVEYIYWR